MMECECEQKDKDCAMNLTLNQSRTQTQIPGQSGRTNAPGLAVAFLNNWPQKQRVQQQQGQQQALRAQRDSLQVVSGRHQGTAMDMDMTLHTRLCRQHIGIQHMSHLPSKRAKI